MGRIGRYFHSTFASLRATVLRFALVPPFLALLTALISLQLEGVFKGGDQAVTRLIFAAIFGAFAGTALEFLIGRPGRLRRYKWPLRAAAVLLVVLYYLFATSRLKTGNIMVVRLVVLCFVLLAFYIWIPAYKNAQDFPANALIHFKAFFVSALYSLVLTLGALAIYFAVNLLLVKLDDKIPGHISNIMGTFFFPIYYLSLLPRFNPENEADRVKREAASAYPKFLEILVSYIALPLITVFTAVLAVYLVKILITLKWPAGELGPMVLGYSATGLLLLVLCGRLANRFAALYRRLFPPVLIPLVGLQLYSVFIRINAYGITESRYYLVLFGIYSVVCAIYLISVKNLRTGAIALLAACFATLSLLPPADAFTLSRNSQSARIEAIFDKNRMLEHGKVVSGSNVPVGDKVEITNIMNYFDRMGHLKKLAWLPDGYENYRDFEKVFGFGQTYGRENPGPDKNAYFNANIDQRLPVDVSGYGAMLRAGIYYSGTGAIEGFDFKLDGKAYRLETAKPSGSDVTFSVFDAAGVKLAELSSGPFLKGLASPGGSGDMGLLAPEKLTCGAQSAGIRIKVIFQNLSFVIGPDGSISEINGDAVVLIGKG